MRMIYIENDYFNPRKSKSKYLISSLKKLSELGYEISFGKDVLKKFNYLKAIFNKEDIFYKTSAKKKDKVIIGKGYRNLSEVILELSGFRKAEIKRKTRETDIIVKINIDGNGDSKIDTGIGFFDHMIDQIARHANLDLELNVKGDLGIDEHHTVEDTGLVLGEAILNAIGPKKGIQRYGYFIPMDETGAICSIDLGGRSYLNFECGFNREKIGDFPTELTEEFFRALSAGMKANIFIKAKGKNEHHKIESIFKAFAKSLNEACRMDERNNNRLPSTKGVL